MKPSSGDVSTVAGNQFPDHSSTRLFRLLGWVNSTGCGICKEVLKLLRVIALMTGNEIDR